MGGRREIRTVGHQSGDHCVGQSSVGDGHIVQTVQACEYGLGLEVLRALTGLGDHTVLQLQHV